MINTRIHKNTRDTGSPGLKKRKVRLWDDSTVIDDSNMDDEFIIGESIEEDSDNEENNYLKTLTERERRFLIEEELRLKKFMSHDIPLKYRIIGLNTSDEIKTQGLTMLKRYNDDPENNSTCLTAAEKLCRIPWNVYHTLTIDHKDHSKFLESSYSIMNDNLIRRIFFN